METTAKRPKQPTTDQKYCPKISLNNCNLSSKKIKITDGMLPLESEKDTSTQTK